MTDFTDDGESYDPNNDSDGNVEDSGNPFNADQGESWTPPQEAPPPRRHENVLAPQDYQAQNNEQYDNADPTLGDQNRQQDDAQALASRGPDPAKIMDYLHGNGGASKQEVDQAIHAASQGGSSQGDSTDQTLIDHANVGGDSGDSEPYDNADKSRVTPPAVKKTASVPPTKVQNTGDASYDPFDTQKDPNPGDIEDPNSPFGQFQRGLKPMHEVLRDGVKQATGYDISKVANAAITALQQAHEKGGPALGFYYAQGMRKLANLFQAHAGVAATGTPNKPADPHEAVNSANKAAGYYPIPEHVMFTAHPDQGNYTLSVDGSKKLALTPAQFSAVMNPGTGWQHDALIEKGPEKAAQDVLASAQRGTATIGAAPPKGQAPSFPGAPTGGDDDEDDGNAFAIPASARAQRQQDEKNAPPGYPMEPQKPMIRTGPIRSGHVPERGYYDDNMNYHKTQNAHNGSMRQDAEDNTDPNAVKMFSRNGVSNGWGPDKQADKQDGKIALENVKHQNRMEEGQQKDTNANQRWQHRDDTSMARARLFNDTRVASLAQGKQLAEEKLAYLRESKASDQVINAARGILQQTPGMNMNDLIARSKQLQGAAQSVGQSVGKQYAPQQSAPQQQGNGPAPAPKDPSQRQINTPYVSPTGKIGIWTGTGWKVQ